MIDWAEKNTAKHYLELESGAKASGFDVSRQYIQAALLIAAAFISSKEKGNV